MSRKKLGNPHKNFKNISKLDRRSKTISSKLIKNQMFLTRSDIQRWRSAMNSAENIYNPQKLELMKIYKEILIDAVLTSQINNRIENTKSSGFSIMIGSTENEELTNKIKRSNFYDRLIHEIIMTEFMGPVLVEFYINDLQELDFITIPREYVDFTRGIVRENVYSTEGISYRELPEYRKWIYEIGDPNELGIINKAVPHVLFKKFAMSCWSEFCEIFGMPTRVLKTNTTDTSQMNRAEEMMSMMGSAAYAIIDETEELEFASTSNNQSGDVYENLINKCNNEICLLVSGAIIGQDTKNGNYSKEESNAKILDRLVRADKRMVENLMNNIIIKGLASIGYLPQNAEYQFKADEDINQLWKMTTEAMPYFDIDEKFMREKFGIPIIGRKNSSSNSFGQAQF